MPPTSTKTAAQNSDERQARSESNLNGAAKTFAARVLRVGANTNQLNVMSDEMPDIPEFPVLPKKSGYVRGHVKNSLGQPVAGAKPG